MSLYRLKRQLLKVAIALAVVYTIVYRWRFAGELRSSSAGTSGQSTTSSSLDNDTPPITAPELQFDHLKQQHEGKLQKEADAKRNVIQQAVEQDAGRPEQLVMKNPEIKVKQGDGERSPSPASPSPPPPPPRPLSASKTSDKPATLQFYHPQCPPHPDIEAVKHPYDHIPKGIQSKVKVICDGGGKTSTGSSIRWYPANVIEMTDVMVDFTKRSVSGDWSTLSKGFVLASCKAKEEIPIGQWDYLAPALSTDVAGVSAKSAHVVIDEPTFIISRDDCGNTWHALSDTLRVFSSQLVVKHRPVDSRVMVLDHRIQISGKPDDIDGCPYQGSLQAMGRKGLLHAHQYAGKKVWFKKLVVVEDRDQLLGLIWSMSSCDAPTIIGQYVNNLFDYFSLKPLNDILVDGSRKDRVIHITFSSRRKKPFAPADAPIGRVIKNERELTDALAAIPGVKVQVAEFFDMKFEEQLKLFRETDVIIGMHGAGLTNLIYTALDGAVIELIPFTWKSTEYSHLSHITGRSYNEWQNPKKENHQELFSCAEFEKRKSKDEPPVCRTGTSVTTADVPAIKTIVEHAVTEIRKKRGWL